MRIDTVPKDLYYHEVAYVRGLEKKLEDIQTCIQENCHSQILDQLVQEILDRK